MRPRVSVVPCVGAMVVLQRDGGVRVRGYKKEERFVLGRMARRSVPEREVHRAARTLFIEGYG